jgi:hypothetical protein
MIEIWQGDCNYIVKCYKVHREMTISCHLDNKLTTC